MKAEKPNFFLKKINFLFFKIFLWISIGLIFINVSILMPINSTDKLKEIFIFLALALVINIYTSFFPVFSRKNRTYNIAILVASIFACSLVEMLLFYKNLKISLSDLSLNKRIYLATFGYIFIRNLALFMFFIWVEYYNQLISLFYKKDKIHQQEMSLLIEKQNFEKDFLRKKLLPHYCFNILEHLHAWAFINNFNSTLLDKIKFVLYYFLVDAEKDKVELNKELAFYEYYIELEKFRHQKNIMVNMQIVGRPDDYTVIPLLFEPFIGNALKYTKQDGTGRIDIEFDASLFPVLNFRCQNNHDHYASSIVSSENGLKIIEQRLKLCYKNNYILKTEQNADLYKVTLSLKVG